MESVINSLLLYGLESIQLTLAEQNCLDAFQMMMLRKLLSCTQCNCIQGGTNQKRLDIVEQCHGYSHITLSMQWMRNKISLLDHILRGPDDDPTRELWFEPLGHVSINHCRREASPERIGLLACLISIL